jgi:hypothetical protein
MRVKSELLPQNLKLFMDLIRNASRHIGNIISLDICLPHGEKAEIARSDAKNFDGFSPSYRVVCIRHGGESVRRANQERVERERRKTKRRKKPMNVIKKWSTSLKKRKINVERQR